MLYNIYANFDKVCSTNFVGDDEMCAVEDKFRWLYVKKLEI